MRYLILLLVATTAFADDKGKAVSDVFAKMGGPDRSALHAPLFVFGPYDVVATPTASLGGGMDVDARPLQSVVAVAADGKSGWMAASLAQANICGMGDCAKAARELAAHPAFHATVLVDGGQPVMIHIGMNLTDKELAARVKDASPGEVSTKIDADAKPVVELVQRTLGDPKAFAATVSDRADVVLFGSDTPERYVGGATVRSTLQGWGIGFKVRDGISAGVTASKTVAWVAANVDGRGKTDKTATPYRMTLIYEKKGADWKLVQAQFSFATN